MNLKINKLYILSFLAITTQLWTTPNENIKKYTLDFLGSVQTKNNFQNTLQLTDKTSDAIKKLAELRTSLIKELNFEKSKKFSLQKNKKIDIYQLILNEIQAFRQKLFIDLMPSPKEIFLKDMTPRKAHKYALLKLQAKTLLLKTFYEETKSPKIEKASTHPSIEVKFFEPFYQQLKFKQKSSKIESLRKNLNDFLTAKHSTLNCPANIKLIIYGSTLKRTATILGKEQITIHLSSSTAEMLSDNLEQLNLEIEKRLFAACVGLIMHNNHEDEINLENTKDCILKGDEKASAAKIITKQVYDNNTDVLVSPLENVSKDASSLMNTTFRINQDTTTETREDYPALTNEYLKQITQIITSFRKLARYKNENFETKVFKKAIDEFVGQCVEKIESLFVEDLQQIDISLKKISVKSKNNNPDFKKLVNILQQNYFNKVDNLILYSKLFIEFLEKKLNFKLILENIQDEVL